MKLFFSGAKTYQGYQPDPASSLGNYVSNVEIQDQLINNLFSTISRYSVQQNKPVSRAIVLLNDELTTYSNFKVWLTYPSDGSPATDTNDAVLEFAQVDLISDGCGGIKFPSSISNENASPYNVVFKTNLEGPSNALNLPDLAPGLMMGLWIRRRLLPSTQQPKSDDDLLAIMNGTLVLPQQEDILVNFTWTP